MSQIIYPITHLPPVIDIGKQTEKGVTRIGFDVHEWLDDWPGMVFSVQPTRPGETESYLAASEMVGSVIFWLVGAVDTEKPGSGTVEVLGVTKDERKLSFMCRTSIANTNTATTAEIPEPDRPWVDKVILAGESAKADAKEAKESAKSAENSAADAAQSADEAAKSAATISGASAPLKQLVTDADGMVAWEDRLAYKYSTEGTVVNLPATEAIVVNDSGDMALTTPWTVEIEAGKTYTVNYNGTDYECLAIAMSAINPEAPAGMCMLGNVQAIIEMEIAGNNPNAPFILATMGNALGAADGAYAQVIPLDGAESVTIAVSYSGVKTDIKPIDPELLGLKTIDIIVKDDGTVSCDFPFADAWAMDERLLAASIRIITRGTKYTSHTYRVWGNGYTVTRTERMSAEGYVPSSARELHIVVPNVLDPDLSNTNAYETRFVWAEVMTEDGSYSDIALCGVQGMPIKKTGPKSYGPDYVSMMVALGFPASNTVSAGAYMRFDGSKWQAVTIDQIKTDLDMPGTGGGTAAEDALYVATVTDLQSDRTASEIRAAVAEGKVCVLIDDDGRVFAYYGETEDTLAGSGQICPTFISTGKHEKGVGVAFKRALVMQGGQVSFVESTFSEPEDTSPLIIEASAWMNPEETAWIVTEPNKSVAEIIAAFKAGRDACAHVRTPGETMYGDFVVLPLVKVQGSTAVVFGASAPGMSAKLEMVNGEEATFEMTTE